MANNFSFVPGGGDLPGMPISLNSSSPLLCWALCNATRDCLAWSYGVPNSTCEKEPLCWLKGQANALVGGNSCRVAGLQDIPGGVGLRPTLNDEFTFFSGLLDQGWWSDGLYTAPSDQVYI